MAIKKLCIPFVNKDLIDDLAENKDSIDELVQNVYVVNGKVGTYIDAGTFKRGTNPSTAENKKLVLASGITGFNANDWVEAAGPFDYTTFEDGDLTLIIINDFNYFNYVLRVGTKAYEQVVTSGTANFSGDIVIHTENIQNGETLTTGKVFKAFKLED